MQYVKCMHYTTQPYKGHDFSTSSVIRKDVTALKPDGKQNTWLFLHQDQTSDLDFFPWILKFREVLIFMLLESGNGDKKDSNFQYLLLLLMFVPTSFLAIINNLWNFYGLVWFSIGCEPKQATKIDLSITQLLCLN